MKFLVVVTPPSIYQKGNKPALTAHLKDAIENNLEVFCDIGEEEVEKFTGKGFSVGAKWELEAANDDDVCIEEGIREIGGKLFHEPTVRPDEYVEDEIGATKKYIHSTLIAPLLFLRASSLN